MKPENKKFATDESDRRLGLHSCHFETLSSESTAKGFINPCRSIEDDKHNGVSRKLIVVRH